MKTFLRLAALLLFANVCFGQGVPIVGTPATLGNVGILSDNTYTAGSTTTPAIPITSGQFTGMNYFKVEFSPLSGSNITTCNVYIDTSLDGINWTQGGAISGQTCSPEGSATNGPAAANYVRVDIYTAGQGQVRVRLLGGMSSLAGGGGGGGVSSVGLSLPAGLFSITGSPVTGSGTLSATFQTISPHLYLGNNTSSSAAAALVQPVFSDLSGTATTVQLPFTYTTTNGSTKLATVGTTFAGTAGNGVCLDSSLNLVTTGCNGSMVYPTGGGIPIVVSGNSWGTTVAAPTGTVVGTTDTQTLTNKSIAGSEINSGTVGATFLPAALSSSASINGLNITASTGTLTITGSKTLTISNSLTLAGTDGTTQTFPSTSGTVITSVSAAGGDLSGTFPNPTVAKVNGLAVVTSKTIIGTNSGGQFIDASSSTLANNTTGTAAGGATGFTIAGLSNGCLQIATNVVTSTGSACGSGGGGMVYPSGSGIPIVVSGTSWGTTVAQPTGAIVGVGQANTYTTGLQSFASATMSLPSAASYAPTTAGLFGYDSTNTRAVLGNGTNTSYLTWITAAPTTLDLTEFSGTLGALTDSGVLTANVVTQTSNGANHQLCTYSTTNKVCVPTTTLPTAAMPALTGDVTGTAGSLSLTVTAINGTAFSGTLNDVVAFGSSNIPLDSGVLYTNLTTQTSNGAANQVCTYTGANKTCVPGSVTNAMLSNSSITINGTSNQITSSTATPALGGSTTLAIANPFTFPGKFTAAASTTSAGSANIPTGSAPTSPTTGDLWNLSGILQFYDGTNKNSLTSIQSAVTSGHCPQFSGTAGLMVDSGSVCPSISGLASTQVVVASSSTAITSYAGFTSDSSGDVTVASLTISNANPGISYFGQGTTAWGTGTTSVGLTAPTSVTSYNVVFPSAASAGTNASSGNFYMKFGTTQNQTGCTASTTELCGYFESSIDLTKDVGSSILPGVNGGTGSQYISFAGPTGAVTFTLPNASATILTNTTAVTVTQGGTGTNTWTAHSLPIGEGTSAISFVGACALGQPFVGQGVGSDPICGNTLNLGASGTLGNIIFGNATSGTVTLETVTGAISGTAQLPANTGVIMETNLAQTLSALQTFGTNISIGGVTATGATGTGNVVFSASSSLTGTVGIGASGSLGALAFGNATSGLLTLETATGAITSYTLQLPVAQPSGSNTFLSCTAANPAVCTWAAGGGGAVSSVNTLTGAAVIEAATSGQMAVSGGSGAALTGAADMTYTTHTFATTANGIFDWSAATGANSLKFPAVVGGTVLNGTSTANLSAPIVITNTNSSNNNTSITMGITAPGTSTGQTVLNVNGASTGGDLADFGTGGTWASGVFSGQTIQAAITPAGSLKLGTAPTVTTPGTGAYEFGTDGTEPASIGAGTSGMVQDSTLNCNVNWGNAVNLGCVPTVFVRQITAADWTCGTGGTNSSCVAAQTIGTLTWTLPLVAANWSMDCTLIVGQATGVTANNWNLQTATNGATNVEADYSQETAATAIASGVTTGQASTTTTFNIGGTWTQGATGTKMPAKIHATIEGASASGTVVNLQLVAPTVADLVTIYRGSSCTIAMKQ